MSQSVTHKLIGSHLVSGDMTPGDEIAIRIDQTLTQDATGTLVMQELEALQLDRARTEVSVQYVDHNLLQTDEKNAEDHEYLRTAAQRFGLWFSKPGNGVSHPTHMQRFGIPGKTMVGSDSHTPAAGSLGMLAIGVGGLEVALAIAGEPLHLRMPEVWGIRLEGELPQWCSAKDVILEMLRRHDVKGGLNRILEYHGPGLDSLSAMDRHVIATWVPNSGPPPRCSPATRPCASSWSPRTAATTGWNCSPTRAPSTTSRRRSTSPRSNRSSRSRRHRATSSRSPRSRANPSPRWSSVPAQTRDCGTSRSLPRWSAAARPPLRSASTSTRHHARS